MHILSIQTFEIPFYPGYVKVHKIYDFIILCPPGTFMVFQNKKKLLSHYYFHQTKFLIVPLQTLSDLSLSELKLLPYYLFYVVKVNLCHPGTFWLSEDVSMHILLLNQEIMRDLSMNCSNTF